VSNRYLASGFGSSGVDSTLARMLGKDVPEKIQFCAECGEPCSPAYAVEKDSTTVYCKTHYEQLFASRCEGCNQPIVGQFVNAQGKKYHTQCAPEGGRCERCHKPIFGETVTLSTKVYHPKCFTCTSCDASLAASYVEVGTSPFCSKCANEVKQSRAGGGAIPGVTYESAAAREERERLRIQNQLYENVQGGKEGCAWCRKVITSDAVSFSGKLYHGECFMCSACGEAIGLNAFTEKAGAAYCHKCAKPTSTSAGSCAGCKQALSGQFVSALEYKYHPQCFKCTDCGTAIKGGYAAKAGQPVCSNCATPKVSSAPAASGERARGFVVDPRSGRKIYK